MYTFRFYIYIYIYLCGMRIPLQKQTNFTIWYRLKTANSPVKCKDKRKSVSIFPKPVNKKHIHIENTQKKRKERRRKKQRKEKFSRTVTTLCVGIFPFRTTHIKYCYFLSLLCLSSSIYVT